MTLGVFLNQISSKLSRGSKLSSFDLFEEDTMVICSDQQNCPEKYLGTNHNIAFPNKLFTNPASNKGQTVARQHTPL